MSGMTFSEKVTLAAGSAAVAITPAAAGAAIFTVQGSPVSLAYNAPGGTTVAWDVDGVGHRLKMLVDPGFGGDQPDAMIGRHHHHHRRTHVLGCAAARHHQIGREMTDRDDHGHPPRGVFQ